MNEQSRETLDAYYAEAASWNKDRVVAARKSQRLTTWIAVIAALIALLEGIALALLMPLKTVVPYTLLVDRNTGYVQALKPLSPEKVSPDSALTQSFLVQYVIARESFDIATVNTDYRKVTMFSADRARSSYLAAMQGNNPESPLNAYPRSTLVTTHVKSVSPIGPDVSLVRFDTVRADAGAGEQPMRSWVAVIRYRYSGEPMKLEDRFVNPLGFQVASYRRDPEAVAAAAAPTSHSVPVTPSSSRPIMINAVPVSTAVPVVVRPDPR